MWVTSMPQVWDEEGAAKGGAVTPAPAAAMLGSLAGWLSRTVQPQPPAPRVCGTAGGPPVTAPRLRLRDGRHLAYCESGVPRTQARFTVVFSHGFTGSREDSVRASQVPTDPSTTTTTLSTSPICCWTRTPAFASLARQVHGRTGEIDLERASVGVGVLGTKTTWQRVLFFFGSIGRWSCQTLSHPRVAMCRAG
jgi:hypothetical protein